MIPEPAPGSRYADRFELRQAMVHAPAYVEYRALDAEVGVEVGLWWLRPGLVAGEARLEQLLGAAVELRRLGHPHLRKLYAAGRGDAGPWASWQLASGAGPAPVRGQAVPLPSLVRWVEAVCGALDALHAVGVVHGRLVPEDVVEVGGTLRLGGGGLLRGVEAGAAQRAWTRWLGYVAPEVRSGATPTAAADVWSVAAIAAAMIGGGDGADDGMRVASRRHPPLADLLRGILAAPPEARPAQLAPLAAAVRDRAGMPYLADDRTGPLRAIPAPARATPGPARPGPGQARGQVRRTAEPDEPTQVDPTRRQVREPETYALPTPNVAPPAPRPAPPQVAIARPRAVDPGSGPVAVVGGDGSGPVAVVGGDGSGPAAIPPGAEGPPRRAFTAPPGGFKAVSMKPQTEAKAATAAAEGKRARLRNISEAGQRTFSVAPGAMGYLAPPRPTSADPHEALARRRRIQLILIAAFLLAAAIGGYLLAVTL